MGSDLLKSEEVTLQDGCESELARGQRTTGRLLREVNSFSFVREEFTVQPLCTATYSSMFVWKLLPALIYESKAGSLMMDASDFALHLL